MLERSVDGMAKTGHALCLASNRSTIQLREQREVYVTRFCESNDLGACSSPTSSTSPATLQWPYMRGDWSSG